MPNNVLDCDRYWPQLFSSCGRIKHPSCDIRSQKTSLSESNQSGKTAVQCLWVPLSKNAEDHSVCQSRPKASPFLLASCDQENPCGRLSVPGVAPYSRGPRSDNHFTVVPAISGGTFLGVEAYHGICQRERPRWQPLYQRVDSSPAAPALDPYSNMFPGFEDLSTILYATEEPHWARVVWNSAVQVIVLARCNPSRLVITPRSFEPGSRINRSAEFMSVKA